MHNEQKINILKKDRSVLLIFLFSSGPSMAHHSMALCLDLSELQTVSLTVCVCLDCYNKYLRLGHLLAIEIYFLQCWRLGSLRSGASMVVR